MKHYRKILLIILGLLLIPGISITAAANTDNNASAAQEVVLESVDESTVTGQASEFSGRLPLNEMVSTADMVFLGVADKIEYVMSTPANAGQGRVPYTFVTYSVEEMVKGDSSIGKVTLRFIGGLDQVKKRYMATSETPQFDAGDRDILFVQGNTVKMCPLVGNKSGRLRVIDGRVYTESGRSVGLGSNSDLMIGKLNRFEEVEKTIVDGQEFRLGYDPNISVTPGKTADLNQVLGKVRSLITPGSSVSKFINANPAALLEGPDMTPAPPPSY